MFRSYQEVHGQDSRVKAASRATLVVFGVLMLFCVFVWVQDQVMAEIVVSKGGYYVSSTEQRPMYR